MARMARLVVPRYPHHVTQRGNRRQRVFFGNEDYSHYLALLRRACKEAETEIWAYCLMPNHVHLVMVPQHDDGLRAALGDAHRRYTRHVNLREGWRGHLWQERFHSFVMEEEHLRAAVRYVELNPVRAGLCHKAVDWPWSSARAHLNGTDDALVKVAPMLERIADWKSYLETERDSSEHDAIRKHTRTGRPLGGEAFQEKLERETGRRVRRGKPGPRSN